MPAAFPKNPSNINGMQNLLGSLSLRQKFFTVGHILPRGGKNPRKNWNLIPHSSIQHPINPIVVCMRVCRASDLGSAVPKIVHKKLKALEVKKKTKPGLYADGGGLYLRVTKTGAKSWVMRYMVKGDARSIGLGSALSVPLAEARETVERLQKALRDGRDPIEERDGRSEKLTFAAAAEAYIKENEPSWKNDKHRQQWRNTVASYVVPLIGDRAVADVDTNDVWSVLEPIWQEKPETARRVKQRMHAILDWSIAKRHRDQMNPVDAMRRVLPQQRETKRHHAALPYGDLPTFLDDLRASNSNRFVRIGLEFLIHTACRTSEVMGARWDEIDDDVWTVPAERMKMGKAHRVPLTEQSAALIDQIRRLGVRSDFIFPGRDWAKPLSNMAFSMAVRRINYDVTVHGFRSSFRDWAAERTSADRDVCEAALAHAVENKVEAAYRRTDFFEKRRVLMTAWSTFLTGAQADVVRLTR